MNILIRADASSKIGTGHLMRCLALAQTCKKNQWQVIFSINDKASVLASRLISESIQVFYLKSLPGSNKDAEETSNLAKDFDCQWVVVDGYHFDAEYQQIIKGFGLKLLFIDDYGHAKHYYADIILNQNISADVNLYHNREPYTQLLLGTDYALLRSEFWQWKQWKRINPPIARKILVTMGGADPDNVTLKVITALQQLDYNKLEALVIIGGSNPHYEQLKLASQKSQFPIRLEKNVTNMPELMAWADLAITAGGSTCWELAFMGLPSLILILAENQRAIAYQLHKLKIGINLGWYEDISAEEIAIVISQFLFNFETREEISQLSQTLVDSEGSNRVLIHLQNEVIRLRKVYQDDCQLLWEWVNDTQVRESAFSLNVINWEDHIQWFTDKFKDPNCYIFIAIDKQDQPIGQVRFDIQVDQQAEIDVSIVSNKRGMGYAHKMINMGIQKLLFHQPIQLVHSFIKPENKASIKAFEKAGFQNLGLKKIKNHIAFHYLWDKGKYANLYSSW